MQHTEKQLFTLYEGCLVRRLPCVGYTWQREYTQIITHQVVVLLQYLMGFADTGSMAVNSLRYSL